LRWRTIRSERSGHESGAAGGNVTGLSLLAPDLAGKRLEICARFCPMFADWPFWKCRLSAAVVEMVDLQATARKLGLEP